eukprot:gene41400-1088_t
MMAVGGSGAGDASKGGGDGRNRADPDTCPRAPPATPHAAHIAASSNVDEGDIGSGDTEPVLTLSWRTGHGLTLSWRNNSDARGD